LIKLEEIYIILFKYSWVDTQSHSLKEHKLWLMNTIIYNIFNTKIINI
jgi:hypothetical protein